MVSEGITRPRRHLCYHGHSSRNAAIFIFTVHQSLMTLTKVERRLLEPPDQVQENKQPLLHVHNPPRKLKAEI